MGSGKSTVGRKLANKLSYPFFDTDRMVEERFNLPEFEIFQKYGDLLFHQTEVEIIRELQSLQDAVISCGGDLPCFGENIKTINNHGVTIYIQMSPKSLANRLYSARKKRAQVDCYIHSLMLLEQFVEQQLQVNKCYYEQAHIHLKGENLQMELLIKMISDYNQKG